MLRWRSVAGPVAFALVAVVLLIYDHLNRRVTEVLFWLTLALIVSVFARALDTIRKQSDELEQQTRDELCDRVTGLSDSRQLQADIEAVLAAPGQRHMLMLVELEGLRSYNDSFGYAAGDELLRSNAQALVDAVTPLGGWAYRGEGSKLAALVPSGDRQTAELFLATTASLRDSDHGLPISKAYGEVAIPDEASDAAGALQLASKRLTVQKQSQQSSARRQAHAVLMAAMSARQPDLRDQVRVVAYRAISLARRIGAAREEIDDIALAAELHDVGMLAVPESVLGKQTPLSAEEAAAIRGHSLAGERIISAAPGLASVARLVRAGSERFDGSGQPDGLAGEAIPLGARVIAVAVAFAALTSQRPYRAALSVEEALAELRRCAGTQFDPRVVEVLAAEIAEDSGSSRQPAPAMA